MYISDTAKSKHTERLITKEWEKIYNMNVSSNDITLKYVKPKIQDYKVKPTNAQS